MVLKKNLEDFKKFDVTPFCYFPYHCNSTEMSNYCVETILEKTNYSYIEPEFAIFGSVLFINRKLLSTLKSKGFNRVLPTNKMEMESLERIWGIVLQQEGYDIEKITLIKNDKYEGNEYFDKYWLGRE